MFESLKKVFDGREEILFAWLFGSMAVGRANSRSDVDIAVYVSNPGLLEDVDWYLNLKVELMAATRREVDLILLNTAKPLVKHMANLHKIPLLSRDPLFEAEYSLRIFDDAMVKRDVAAQKLSQIQKSLDKIGEYSALSYDEFCRHPVARDVVEYNLFIVINSMIDIASHIVTDETYGEVDQLADGFRILAGHGYWSEEQALTYVKMVAFRNMIAHQYADVSPKVVYDVLQNKLGDIASFKQIILGRL